MSNQPGGRSRTRNRGQWGHFALIVLGVAAALVILPRVLPPLRVMETLLEDLRITYFTPAEPQHRDIVIIGIDEDTLARLPYRSPIDREFLAGVVTALEAAGVRAIGLDILLDQATEPAKDAALRRAFDTARVPIVQITATEPFPMTPRQRAFHAAFLEGLPAGYANLAKDVADATVRWQYPRQIAGTGAMPSFPAMVARAVGVEAPDRPMRIAWRGSPDAVRPAFATYPAHAVAALPAAWLAGRIALIGLTIPGSDAHRTPLSVATGATAGVEIHAHALAQILDGRPAPQAGPGLEALVAVGMAGLGAGLARLRLPLALKALGSILGLAVLWIGGFALFAWGGPLLPLMIPSFGFAVAAGLETGLAVRRQRTQGRYIREAFGRYVAPAVVARLEADPDRLKLGGERREMTFIFTDLEGFTSISETMPPEALTALLNEYLDGMTAIVMAHEGTVDKFVGDAIIAFFGAPEDQPDHAPRAVGCGLDLDRYARDFEVVCRRRGQRIGVTRIGIHTGLATIGNFGGKRRFNYTAIGDAVNTAARLEGANKHLGTRMLVSAATAERCPGQVFRPVGDLVLKGKAKAISVLEPVSPGQMPMPAIAAYRTAFHLLAANRDGADAAFDELARLLPGDPLVRLHRSRLKAGEPGIRIVFPDK